MAPADESAIATTAYDVAVRAKAGIPAEAIDMLGAALGLSGSTLAKSMDLSTAMLYRRRRQAVPLAPADTERVLGVQAIVETLVGAMDWPRATERGIDPWHAIGTWLAAPVPSLGNRAPLDLLDTVAGQQADEPGKIREFDADFAYMLNLSKFSFP